MSTSPRRVFSFASFSVLPSSVLLSAVLFFVGGGGLVSGCSGPTEIVLQISAPATGGPASVIAKLQRSTPFGDNPMPTALPSFVTTYLDNAALALAITLSGTTTSISLLPAKNAPSDLRISVTAGGFSVAPAKPVDIMFTDGKSQTVVFTVSAPAPDMGMPRRDMAMPKTGDSGVVDMSIVDAATGG